MSDDATAGPLAGGVPDRNRVSVDLGRMSTNRMIVGFEDCGRVPRIGDLVDAVDLATGQEAPAEVVGLDEKRKTVALAIDWMRLREVSV